MFRQFQLVDDLEYIQDIAIGYSSSVTLQKIKETGTQVAIKTFTTAKVSHKQANESFEHEMDILKIVQIHSNILYGYGIVEIDVADDKTHRSRRLPTNYLVLEYLTNGSLLNYLNKFPTLSEITSRHYFRKIVDILIFVHINDIVHRDLTLGNIMLNKDFEVKLIDFAFSRRYLHNQTRFSKLSDFIGTPPYIAPEIVEGAPYLPYPTEIFSLGVILYMMFYGADPFTNASEEEPSYLTFLEKTPSNDIDDLIMKMVAYDPKRRLTIEQVLDHTWMQSYNKEDEITAINELKKNVNQN